MGYEWYIHRSIKSLANLALAAVPFLDIDFENLPETMVPLINRLVLLTFLLPVFAIIPVYLSLAERLVFTSWNCTVDMSKAN